MRRSTSLLFLAFLPALMVAPVVGCSSETQTAASCVDGRLEAQGRERFIVGHTFYMPGVAAGSTCSGVSWTLTSAPDGNKNEVVMGVDGYARFTPHVEGVYTFALGDQAGTVETLNVISSEGVPFHNLNYFPGQSIAVVQDEVWTADVYASTLSRLDPQTLQSRGQIQVGSWPVAIAWKSGMAHVVIAQRGNDTLGLVDLESKRIVDAIWVGDEPSNVILSPDGKTAYASLATENAVVFVDLEKKMVLGRVSTGVDPRAMALSSDGSTLYVASYRSGQSNRFPHAMDPIDEQKDIAVIDTKAMSLKTYFHEVGGMIQGLTFAPDGSKLYVATTQNNTQANLLNIDEAAFAHRVLALDPVSGAVLKSADLSRQATSKGFAATLHGLALADGKLWAVAESSDVVVGLDPNTLEEQTRFVAEGRPRALVAQGKDLFVHGVQAMKVTKSAADAAMPMAGQTRKDPRPELVAQGMQRFTGAGKGYAQNHACNSCHADGLSDRLNWKIGPLNLWETSRPQFWLEGTELIGWTGYVSSARNFALAGNGTIGDKPTTAEFEGMSAYLSSMMPPPAANGKTNRDGALSQEALAGKKIFETKGGCGGCHAMPLATNQQLLENGITKGETDVPSLVGAYRHGSWLKHGDARDLRTAVDMVVDSLGLPNITDADIDSMTRYMEEFTARDFFLLASHPKKNATAAVDGSIELSFSYPVFNDPKNLSRIQLLDSAGAPVSAKVVADARHVMITPDKPLASAANYSVAIARDFESFGERPMIADTKVPFVTAKPAALNLDGPFTWTVSIPVYNPQQGVFDPSKTIPVQVNTSATKASSGSKLLFDYGEDLQFGVTAIIEGTDVHIPPTPVPVNNNFADTRDIVGKIFDDDGDGKADRIEGTLTVTGPGMYFPNMPFVLKKPAGNDCIEGPSGMPAMSVGVGPGGLAQIDWGAEEAIAFFVTSPGAQLPFGPGQTVSNGTAYWGLQTAMFPTGFVGPLTYGTLPANAEDVSEANGAMAGGTKLESGTCYEFSVITTSFSIGKFVKRW